MALRACKEGTSGSGHASPLVQAFEVNILQIIQDSCSGEKWLTYTDRPFAQTRANKTPQFPLRLCAIEAYPALFLFFRHVVMIMLQREIVTVTTACMMVN